MKIDSKLSRLLDALGSSSSSRTTEATPAKQQLTADEINGETVGAVRVASDFGVNGSEKGGESRTDKIARLKAAVESDQYQPNLTRVAESVARDLL